MEEIRANILEGKYEEILAAVQSPVIALTELVKNAADSCIDKDKSITVNIHTSNKVIEVIDYGEGISQNEIRHLGQAGYSSKMIGENIMSPIHNPLAGSKGLGLLTAFFIANSMEVYTYSAQDKKAYHIIWIKGEQKFSFENYDGKLVGTKIILKDIDDDKLRMILLPEEKVKLFMTSLRFFTEDSKLPKIQLIIDGKEECYYPTETIESFYYKNKASNNGFIAKASFKYENNQIYLSYEDNTSGFYTFTDKIIDLTDRSSVDRFVNDVKTPEKGTVPISKIRESELFDTSYFSVHIPSFSGILYTWRNRKEEELEQWPVGVRIYVNNYSLYRYLDRDNDWLNLSEVSQNVKATNYKLKNTYGYLNMDNYNENVEELKISKERNDFVDSLAQRKFIKIMREIVVSIFTRIDMVAKNPPLKDLRINQNNICARLGETICLRNHIACTNMGLEDIKVNYDTTMLLMDDDWNFTAKSAGKYEIELSYDQNVYKLYVQFKEKVPEFALSKKTIEILKGNTINLRDYILPQSCKDVDLDSINIVPHNGSTIINNDLFDKENSPGQHIILYKYGDYQKTLIVNVKEMEKQPGIGAKALRIDSLFPQLDLLREKSLKIPELIDGISSYYVETPTLCMAAIRILVESSCKSFFQYLKNEENNFSFPSLVNRILSLQSCTETAPDYKEYILSHDQIFINDFKEISSRYNTVLSKDIKKNIKAHMDNIDLDMFVHNPNVVATDVTVYRSMQVFAPLLNFVFDVLLLEKS